MDKDQELYKARLLTGLIALGMMIVGAVTCVKIIVDTVYQ